jgi:hypothetical protein
MPCDALQSGWRRIWQFKIIFHRDSESVRVYGGGHLWPTVVAEGRIVRPVLSTQLELLRPGLGVRRAKRFPEDLLAYRHVAPSATAVVVVQDPQGWCVEFGQRRRTSSSPGCRRAPWPGHGLTAYAAQVVSRPSDHGASASAAQAPISRQCGTAASSWSSDYSRLARRKRRSMRPAPHFASSGSHSVRANPNSGLSPAQYPAQLPSLTARHGQHFPLQVRNRLPERLRFGLPSWSREFDSCYCSTTARCRFAA